MLNLDLIKKYILSKFPRLGPAFVDLKFIENNEITETAATDGKDIFFNKSYMESINPYEQAFVVSHELLHINFNHPIRKKDKDHHVWNIACDAVINQILKAEALPIPDGAIDFEWAKNMDSEQVYDHLMKNPQLIPPKNISNHDIWKEAKVAKTSGDDEKNFIQNNAKTRTEKANQIQKNSDKKFASKTNLTSQTFTLTPGGQNQVNWKKILKKELEETKPVWNYRRATSSNYYCARIGEVEQSEKAIVEVMMDSSGSVSDDLLRSFLTELKTITHSAELYAGCFDTKFYGFTKIRNQSDIENFKLQGRGGTDFERAVTGFSDKPGVTKIVFTDGEDYFRLDDNKYKDITWLVYRNKEFKPAVGRVIYVNELKINYKGLQK